MHLAVFFCHFSHFDLPRRVRVGREQTVAQSAVLEHARSVGFLRCGLTVWCQNGAQERIRAQPTSATTQQHIERACRERRTIVRGPQRSPHAAAFRLGITTGANQNAAKTGHRPVCSQGTNGQARVGLVHSDYGLDIPTRPGLATIEFARESRRQRECRG